MRDLDPAVTAAPLPAQQEQAGEHRAASVPEAPTPLAPAASRPVAGLSTDAPLGNRVAATFAVSDTARWRRRRRRR